MHREIFIACLPYLAGLVGSVLFLRLLAALSGGRLQLAQLHQLHRDERGAVQSLSFVLTLPLFVMVMLFIVQLSQLTIGRIVVEYAAYAAARSAVVWIPANLENGIEQENGIGDVPLVQLPDFEDENGNYFSCYAVYPTAGLGGTKLDRIRMAAAQALMSVCPSRDGAAPGSQAGSLASSIEAAYLALSPAASQNNRIGPRIRNKLAYALANTDVIVEIRHKEDDEQLGLWDANGGLPSDIGPDYGEFAFNEIGYQDQIIVHVIHNFALLPGPGRLLSRPLSSTQVPLDYVSPRIRLNNGVYTYPMTATVTLSNEGEKPVFSYVQQRSS